MNHSLAQ